MSCDIWNSTEINPPVTKTYESKSHDIDFASIHTLLSTGVQTHTVPKILLVESCVMNKVISKLKLQFKHDKGFKLFESTSRYLQHFFDLEMSKDLKYFLDFVPQKNETVLTLPSKQMLEYVLVRLQGYAQVCARIVETCYKCTNFMKTSPKWETALVIIAIENRIWFLCRHYAMKCCSLYNNLLPLLDKLDLIDDKWLSDMYVFPSDLKKWLNYDWLIEIPNMGIPKFLDDDLEFIGPYYHTYITGYSDDDDDDDDESNIKFICNLNNKKITLNKKQVKYLQSRIAISVDADDDNFVPSSEYDDIFELLDDIQIIDDTVTKDDKLDENKNVELNDNESNDVPKIEEKIDHSPEDQDTITKDDKLDENKNVELKDESNDVPKIEEKMDHPPEDQDTITKDDKLDENKNVELKDESNVPKIEEKMDHSPEDQDIVIISDDEIDVIEEKEQEEMEVEYNDDNEKQEENEYNEEIKKPIKIFEKLYHFDTIEKFKSLLQNENINRKTDKRELCLFIYIPDNLWYHIVFHIKYFIAMTIDNPQNKNKYLIKSKNLLSSITFENTRLDNLPFLKNKFKAEDIPASMTLKGIEYLINSIDSLSDLQIFITKEIHKRSIAIRNSLFSNFNFKEWAQICTNIKYLIIMGVKNPISSEVYLKKAKSKLTQLLLNKKNVDSVLSSDNINVDQQNDFDNIYKNLTQDDSFSQLFKYIQEIEDYVYPPKMINALKEKIGGQNMKYDIKFISESYKKINTFKRPPLEQNYLPVPLKKSRMNKQRRQTEKEIKQAELRQTIDKYFQAEEEENSYLFSHTPELTDARMKFLEEKINKLDDIWGLNETIIDELEQTRKNFLTVEVSHQNNKRNKRRNQNNIPIQNEPQYFNINCNNNTPNTSFNPPRPPPPCNNRPCPNPSRRRRTQKETGRFIDQQQYMRMQYEENLYRQNDCNRRQSDYQQYYNGPNFGGYERRYY